MRLYATNKININNNKDTSNHAYFFIFSINEKATVNSHKFHFIFNVECARLSFGSFGWGIKQERKENKNTNRFRDRRDAKKKIKKRIRNKYYKGVDGYIRDDNYALYLRFVLGDLINDVVILL